MSVDDEQEKILKEIKDSLSDDDKIGVVLVYGSLASSQLKSHSDIDIAYLNPRDKIVSRSDVMKKLRNADIDRKIDLVDLNDISPTLAMQILKNHKIIFNRIERDFELWKIRMLNQYHDLQIANREIYANLGKYSPLKD